MSPIELQEKYMVALELIGGKPEQPICDRQMPIYQGSSQMTEQRAVEVAAKALSALWNVDRREKR